MKSPEDLRFTVLGPVTAVALRGELPLGTPQQRVVLAALLMRRGHQVSVEELVDAVWGDAPPPSAVGTVRVHIHRLRKVLDAACGSRPAGGNAGHSAPGEAAIRSVSSGYLMPRDAGVLDFSKFQYKVSEARRELPADPGRAVELLREAQGLWQGDALAGLPGNWARTQRSYLSRLRLSALESRLGAQLALGTPSEVVAELASLVGDHPLDERFREMLMIALYRSGRQAAALDVYQDAQKLLAEELGIDPGPALRALHQDILRAAPGLLGPGPASGTAVPSTGTGRTRLAVDLAGADRAERDDQPAAAPDGHLAERAVGLYPVNPPAQLPYDPPTFIGRQRESGRLDELLDVSGGPAGSVPGGMVCAITGMAGVGKTAFAVRYARRMAARFPDGQIYLDLRGFEPDGEPLAPEWALRAALEALGMPPDKLPRDLAGRTALYRTVLAERQMLILLDNVRDAQQIRPLLPGSPGCLVLVTSRDQLTGLIVKDGAHHLRLDMLSADESREVLVRRLGAARVDAEPQAVSEIIERTSRLPLALALVAARAATRDTFPLAVIADELRAERTTLNAFHHSDVTLDMRSVFSASYHVLSADAARLCRLLAVNPGPDCAPAAAAALAGLSAARCSALLGELSTAHLITEYMPGRFKSHDLIRVYALELLRENPVDEQEARRRLFDHYLLTAHTAAQSVARSSKEIAAAGTPAARGRFALPLTDSRTAMEWFLAENAGLLACIERGGELPGYEEGTLRLIRYVSEFLRRCNRWDQEAAVQRVALAVSGRTGDLRGSAQAHNDLARAHIETDHYLLADEHLARALDLFESLGDQTGQAHAHDRAALAHIRRADHEAALPHALTAVRLFRATGDRTEQANALNNVAWIYSLRQEPEQAIAHCEQALGLLQESGSLPAQAAVWDSLGRIRHYFGEHGEALECYRRAISVDKDLADACKEAHTLVHMGEAHLAAGDRDATRLSWVAALPLMELINPFNADILRKQLSGLDDRSAEDVIVSAPSRPGGLRTA